MGHSKASYGAEANRRGMNLTELKDGFCWHDPRRYQRFVSKIVKEKQSSLTFDRMKLPETTNNIIGSPNRSMGFIRFFIAGGLGRRNG